MINGSQQVNQTKNIDPWITLATSHTVKIVANTPIYRIPGFEQAVDREIHGSDVYTIVEEVYTDGKKWEKPKSGEGWMCLDEKKQRMIDMPASGVAARL
jgi:hypothetical protein